MQLTQINNSFFTQHKYCKTITEEPTSQQQQVVCRDMLLWDCSVDLFYQGTARIKHGLD